MHLTSPGASVLPLRLVLREALACLACLAPVNVADHGAPLKILLSSGLLPAELLQHLRLWTAVEYLHMLRRSLHDPL